MRQRLNNKNGCSTDQTRGLDRSTSPESQGQLVGAEKV